MRTSGEGKYGERRVNKTTRRNEEGRGGWGRNELRTEHGGGGGGGERVLLWWVYFK